MSVILALFPSLPLPLTRHQLRKKAKEKKKIPTTESIQKEYQKYFARLRGNHFRSKKKRSIFLPAAAVSHHY